MLKKWFPQMENFSGQLKKYKVTINDLLAENEKLEVRAKASEKGKMCWTTLFIVEKLLSGEEKRKKFKAAVMNIMW